MVQGYWLRRGTLGQALAALVLAMGLVVAGATAVSADVEEGALECAGYEHGYKVDPPVDDSRTHEGVTVSVDVADNMKSLTFSTSPATSVTVFVKGGNDATVFTGTGGTVQSPINNGDQQANISHYTVCWSAAAEPTATPTTPSEEPTATPTTPSEEPTATPTTPAGQTPTPPRGTGDETPTPVPGVTKTPQLPTTLPSTGAGQSSMETSWMIFAGLMAAGALAITALTLKARGSAARR